MPDVSGPATKVAPSAVRLAPALRQASAHAVAQRRMLSQPGEAAERSASARAARALSSAFSAHSRSPRQRQFLPPDTPSAIAGTAGYGRSMPPDLAANFGSRPGADLSHADTHGDAIATQTDVGKARAFTLGSDGFFDRGGLRPETRAGRALLAHEFAHVPNATDDPAQLPRQPGAENSEDDVASGNAMTSSVLTDQPLSSTVPSQIPAVMVKPLCLPASDRGAERLYQDKGRPLPDATRISVQRALGRPPPETLLHTDAAAADVADRMGASAFTVGHHVFFGSGQFRPGTVHGDLLIGHELAHVIQQARSLGRPFGEGRRQNPRLEAEARSFAVSTVLGQGVAPVSPAPVGIALADKGSIGGSVSAILGVLAQEYLGRSFMRSIGAVEGVLLEAGNIVDILLWLPHAKVELVDAEVDRVAASGHLSSAKTEILRSVMHAIAQDNVLAVKLAKDLAARVGAVDPVTGAPAVSHLITRPGDWLEQTLNRTGFAGTTPETGLLTEREMAQIAFAVGVQALLGFVGAEEVQMALKVLSLLGGVKSIVTTAQREAHEGRSFVKSRDFWVAVGAAVLNVLGLLAASGKRKLLVLFVDSVSLVVNTAPPILTLADDILNYQGPDREEKLHNDLLMVVRAALDVMRQVIMHLATASRTRREPAPPGRLSPGVGETSLERPPEAGGGLAAGAMAPEPTAGLSGPAASPGGATATQPVPPETESRTAPPPGKPSAPLPESISAPPARTRLQLDRAAQALEQRIETLKSHPDAAKMAGELDIIKGALRGGRETDASARITELQRRVARAQLYQAEGGLERVYSESEEAIGRRVIEYIPTAEGSPLELDPTTPRPNDATGQKLLAHVRRAIQEFESNGFTQTEAAALRGVEKSKRSTLRDAFRGSHIDRVAKRAIMQDPSLEHVLVTVNFERGADFYDSRTGYWYDITTTKAWKQHVADYGPTQKGRTTIPGFRLPVETQ